MIDLDAAKDRFLAQWQHCPGNALHAQNSQILCECGATWPWQGTLGEAIEWLALMDEVKKVKEDPPPYGEESVPAPALQLFG